MITPSAHPADDDLILHYYGESSNPASIHAHLAMCGDCRSAYEAIARTLTMVATTALPARGDHYGLEVWQRIRPLLPPPDPWSRVLRVRWSTLTAAAAVAVFAIAAFIAGRYWPSSVPNVPAPLQTASARSDGDDRVRTMAIADHLERSERLLIDMANADPNADVSIEQAWAADLIDANRLYREAATQAGEATTASVLDDLERSLLDIVHAPSPLTPAELEEVRARLDAAALLFKVRVLSNELRERETAPNAPRKTT